KQAPVLAVYDVGNLDEIKKYNAINLDASGRITFFEEKPRNPTSTLTGIALYYYPKATLPLIQQYVAEGNNPDQPGRLIQWLYPHLRPALTSLLAVSSPARQAETARTAVFPHASSARSPPKQLPYPLYTPC